MLLSPALSTDGKCHSQWKPALLHYLIIPDLSMWHKKVQRQPKAKKQVNIPEEFPVLFFCMLSTVEKFQVLTHRHNPHHRRWTILWGCEPLRLFSIFLKIYLLGHLFDLYCFVFFHVHGSTEDPCPHLHSLKWQPDSNKEGKQQVTALGCRQEK